jgi:hypothetical protein
MALSPTCPSDKKSFKIKATMEHRLNIERRQVLGKKPVPVLLCLPQISLGLNTDQTQISVLRDQCPSTVQRFSSYAPQSKHAASPLQSPTEEK